MNHNPPSSSDEISLVDLAVLLVRRWKLMLVVFLVIALASLAVVLARPATYTYTSLYSIAEFQNAKGEIVPLETTNALLARLRLQIYPGEVRALLKESQWTQLPFDVSFSQPQGTRLIALTSSASEELQAIVEQLHGESLAALTQSQQRLVERTEHSLTLRLDGLNSAILQVGVVGGDLTAQANQLEAQLAAIQPGGVSQLAVRSLSPQGVSSWLIVCAGALAGLILAILAAFGSHFAVTVRQRLIHA